MKVYLAASYSRREELASYAADVESRGMVVTSRWLLGPNHRKLGDAGTLSEHAEWLVERDFDSTVGRRVGALCAQQDVEDVLAADALVLFTGGGRGGRHVEFGVALGAGKRLFVVGAGRENVFHTLPNVVGAASWREVLDELAPVAA